MAFQANVLSVMIASPGDVSEERRIVRDVVHDWNDIHAKSTRCVLLPVGWETHSAPDLSGRAQEILNKSVLSHCDLLVGVFWTRLGTPTGDFESGSVEEIKRHISQDKPAMVYFSTAPVALDSVDQSQYEALKKFKDWCYDNGLIETYDNVDDFAEKFRRHIQIKVRDHPLLVGREGDNPSGISVNQSPVADLGLADRLSNESKQLICEAAKDPDGTILHFRFISGQTIQANGINFADSKDRRSVAKWEAALEQLEAEALIVDRGGKREVYELTALGFKVVDEIGGMIDI